MIGRKVDLTRLRPPGELVGLLPPGGKAGVMRRQNWGKYDNIRKGKVRLRNVRKFSVNATPDQRHRAAMWAASKAGQGYDNPGRPYNYNFAFNRRDSGKYNCSQFIWSAYMNVSGGQLDLDANGGHGVYLGDILQSPLLEECSTSGVDG